MTPAIRVRHLSHRFGNHDVLRDVSFEVGAGEIFGFIGPNGAGKTTTIRILTTLLEPLAGRVEVDGHDVGVDPEKVRTVIGYMPDHAGVYDRVTSREYLEFFADAYRVPTAGSTYAVVDAVMELTDLVKLSDKLVATMSKGMKQRLQLARTLLHDPKVLILDEPASDLDPRARIEMRDLLLELRDMGKTVFLSSHILTELADVCSSVAILERGRLVVAGPISEIGRRLTEARQAQRANGPTSVRHGAGGPTGRPDPNAYQGQPYPQQPGTPQEQSASREQGGAQGAGFAMAPPYEDDLSAAKLRVLTSLEVVQAALAPLPSVRSVANAPGTRNEGSTLLLLTYIGDEHVLSEIVRALVLSNIPVIGVEPERSELERIFLEVTRGEVQ